VNDVHTFNAFHVKITQFPPFTSMHVNYDTVYAEEIAEDGR
jgi:hypothetical protein